jgi:Holliday junction resolvasome RuvABC endonuclease subunit
MTGQPGGALRVCGLDPSLTSFGGAVTRGPGVPPELFRFRTKLDGHERLDYLLAEVRTLARGCDLAVVEGTPVMKNAQTAMALAGLHWLTRHALWELGIPYAVVQPSSRIKWLAGRGSGVEKDDCLVMAIKRFPLADIRGNDQADALTLSAMGSAAYGQPLVPMPADREAVLTAIKVVKRPGGSVRVPAINWPRLKDLEALGARSA